MLVYVLAALECLVEVAAHEQVHCLHAALHTSRGVDARANLEDDLAYGYVFVGEFAEADYTA
jgi:hypothetical protein